MQPPERAIFERLESVLPAARMLDLGMGGGRTTAHLAPKVAQYLGVDYAPAMVNVCANRFPALEFRTGDARDLRSLSSGSFDLVLFSYNGVDYVDSEGRAAALGEMARLLSPSGALIFSSHNVHSLAALMHGEAREGVWTRMRLWRRRSRIRASNPSAKELMAHDGVSVSDGAFNFRLMTYYIKPAAQVAALRALGFTSVDVYDLSRGTILAPEEWESCTDPWLYYLCTRG